ncbi:hypothetical protein D910_04008, partial [Dendroctonus ponderosae]
MNLRRGRKYPSTKLPVLFWIYGGAYREGNSRKHLYGPDYLVEEDVIVVSFNYRVGAFGFLSSADEALPGNNGMKDQLLALKWTHENIQHFGGDPEKITIFGESAGSSSVGLHLISKKSADVANTRALGQSFDTYPEAIIPDNLDADKEVLETVIDKIKSIYLEEGEQFEDNLVAVTQLYSDSLFGRAILKHADLQSAYTPVYLYQFSYYGARHVMEPFIDGAEKVAHSSDLPYLFYWPRSAQAEDLLVQNRLVKLWTNFAKYLNPTPEESALFNNVIWTPHTEENSIYLNINTTLELNTHLKERTMA